MSPSALPLDGIGLLVTGPAGPLAARIAAAAQQRGARVVLAVPAPADAVEGGPARLRAEVRTEADADRLIDAVVERLDRLDLVVAVIAGETTGPLHELTLDAWRERVVEPLRRTFWLARRVMDEFLAGGRGGRLVLVADSKGGTAGEPADVFDEALASLVRSCAREYGPRGVVCNLVLPARTGSNADQVRGLVETTLFLAGPAASFITGEALRVGSTPSGSTPVQ